VYVKRKAFGKRSEAAAAGWGRKRKFGDFTSNIERDPV